MKVNPIDVQKHLKGVEYPATGDELAAEAEANGAPSGIVEQLRSLAGELDGPDDVMRQLGQEDEED